MISVHYLHQRHILWRWFPVFATKRLMIPAPTSDGAERQILLNTSTSISLYQDLNNLERCTGLSAQHLRKVHIAARRSCQRGDESIPRYLHWSARAMRGHLCVPESHSMVWGSSLRSTSCRWSICDALEATVKWLIFFMEIFVAVDAIVNMNMNIVYTTWT